MERVLLVFSSTFVMYLDSFASFLSLKKSIKVLFSSYIVGGGYSN